jgi:hypothetical protein
MDKISLEQRIREVWFKDHIATLTEYGDLKVLDWKEPGTIIYYIRYVFDGSRMYITGDLGEAVFCLTWKADIHSFNGLSLGYFHEKLSAYHEDKYDFDSDKAVKRLREWLNDLKDNEVEYDHDEMKELFEEARGCGEEWEWIEVIHNHDDFISKLEPDYWEWFYNIGREYPARFISYLIGLQMASEQLSE